jgi:2TM domain-containing protein
MPERSFSEDEVREILRRAVDRDAAQGGHLDRARLVAAAQEIGIDPTAVDHAIQEIERDRTLDTELTALRLERRHDFISNVSTFGIVNSGLLAIDWANGGGWWFYWPLTIWGTFLLLRHKRLLFTNDIKDRKKAAARIESRQAALARKVARQRRQAKGRQLEEVIERGVELLVEAATRHLDGSRRSASPPPPAQQARPRRTRLDDADDDLREHERDVEPGARRRTDRG